MKANTLLKVLAWHRRLALVLGVFVMMWALTGVLHPIMSATQPQPAKRMPPPQQLQLQDAIPLPTLLQQQGITQLSQVQVLQLGQAQAHDLQHHQQQHHKTLIHKNQSPILAYRVQQPEQAVGLYINAQTGKPIVNGEQRDAEQLALWYSGLTTQQIRGSQLVTAFNDDYPSVNRLLPVWRVDFDNGLRAYVEPSQRRLATLSNDSKMWMARIFRLGHTWSIGQDDGQGLERWWGKDILMKAVLIGLLAMALLGLTLFVKIHNRQNHRLKDKPTRRFHRYLGASLWVFVVAWLSSGLYHHWHKSEKITLPTAVFNVETLSLNAWQQATQKPLQQLNLVASNFKAENGSVTAQAAWLLRYPSQRTMQPSGQASGQTSGQASSQPSGQQGSMINHKSGSHAEHQHHQANKAQPPKISLLDANTAQVITPEQQAKQLTAFALGLPLQQLIQTEWVTQFGGEYGFINKRLPVIKVQSTLDNDQRLYIEPSTGLIASSVTNADALEGLSFAYLHKWRFIDINKTLLDVLMGITAALIALLVALGYRVYWLKRRQ